VEKREKKTQNSGSASHLSITSQERGEVEKGPNTVINYFTVVESIVRGNENEKIREGNA